MNYETFKERVSIRGIVMTILTLVVAGLAIATVSYTPSAPDEGPRSPEPTSTTAPVVVPSPPPAPPIAPPVTTIELPPTDQPPDFQDAPLDVPTYTPTPTSSVTTSSTTATSPSEQPAFPIRPTHGNSAELPNGGRRQ